MPPRNAPPRVAPDAATPPLIFEFPPESFAGRARYAANDAVKGRGGKPGIIAGLRDAFSEAGGKTVKVTITTT
jgi:hypothetical protein